MDEQRPDWADEVDKNLETAVNALQQAIEELVAHPRASWVETGGRSPILHDHWPWLPGGDPLAAASAAHRHALVALTDLRGEERK